MYFSCIPVHGLSNPSRDPAEARALAGAESPTFIIYSATGAEILKWALKSMGNGVSLVISRLTQSLSPPLEFPPHKLIERRK